MPTHGSDPHGKQPTLIAGPPPDHADAMLILVHGRGATAESMLSLLDALDVPNVAAIAPQAAGNTWYPLSFLSPIEANQPYLDSGLARLDLIVTDLMQQHRVSAKRIAMLGFSQGACLTL